MGISVRWFMSHHGLIDSVLLRVIGVFVFAHAHLAAETHDIKPQVPVRHQALLQQNCQSCHGPDKQKGKFRVDELPYTITTVEAAERWQKVLNALNAGDMPPEEEKQLDKIQKTELLEDLAKSMVVARKVLSDQGGQITLRRLNRREYSNTIRDLLGVDIIVSDLPNDSSASAFDTVGSGLFMSSSQFEGYRTLGREALDAAFRLHVFPKPINKIHIEPEVETNPRVVQTLKKRTDAYERYKKWIAGVDAAAQKQENQAVVEAIRAEDKKNDRHLYNSWQKIPGAPSPKEFNFTDADHAMHDGINNWTGLVPYHRFYTEQPYLDTGTYLSIGNNADNSMNPYEVFTVPHNWPAGDYVVRVRMAATDNTSAARHFVTLGPRALMTTTHHVTGTMTAPQVINIPITIPPGGNRTLSFSEKGTLEPDEQAARIQQKARKENGIGAPFALWIDWIEVEGPFNHQRGTPPALAAMTFPLSKDAVVDSVVRGMLEQFAREAFRGKDPSPRFIDRLMALYNERVKAGEKSDLAIREPLSVILASPHFLYLAEPVIDAQQRTLNDHELAIRLSYFLWSAPPDKQLMSLADRGELSNPANLAAEVNRLLTSDKANAFMAGFTHQWLSMDRLDFFKFNPKLFPEFCKSVKTSAKEEVYATMGLLVRDNLSLRNLLKSDFVVIDAVMANYYGIAGVSGDQFRRVTLPKDSPRGGLLGMAGILAMGGNGEHTSPVERGAWILRKLLHDPPPPAPANVPQLMRLEGKVLTTRERNIAHQEQPQCASCHRSIDPIGFGMENFDAAGLWRTEDHYEKKGVGKKTWAIDPSGAFHRGATFKDYFEMRDLIAAKADDFAQGFTEALLEYALGRPCGFSDQPLITSVCERAKKHDYVLREFIHATVSSPAFHRK